MATEPARRPAAALGFAITLAHVLVAWLLSFICGSPHGYRALNHWDSEWYGRIVTEGYQSAPVITKPVSSGFFPGYPLAVALVSGLTRMDVEYAMPLTAQLCYCGMWTYLIVLCRRWGFSESAILVVVAVLVLHPFSIFQIAGYSESLFVMSALGFIFWSSPPAEGPR